MDLGQAVNWLKQGQKMRRESWPEGRALTYEDNRIRVEGEYLDWIPGQDDILEDDWVFVTPAEPEEDLGDPSVND